MGLTVQWGTNQNVIFEIAVRKISRLPTLKASRNSPTKNYSKSTNIGRCGEFFTAANFDNLAKFEFFFAMKFLEKKPLYVNIIWLKFQVQIINKKKILIIYQHV
jgi:hypothetical protein